MLKREYHLRTSSLSSILAMGSAPLAGVTRTTLETANHIVPIIFCTANQRFPYKSISFAQNFEFIHTRAHANEWPGLFQRTN